jgi:predicted nucleic acid-binding protein
VIYLDTSVALAHLLGETRVPPASLWEQSLVSSRLLEYELWTRIHARGLTRSHAEPVRELLSVVALIELSPVVLARALEPFPASVRTLDALHLASMSYLRDRDGSLTLASYDDRLVRAARALGIGVVA